MMEKTFGGLLMIAVVAITSSATADDRGSTAKDQDSVEQHSEEKKVIRKTRNRLQNERSPYLLQHADNPVDWYPWGDEAFARAGKEDKPIFLSIGYSTCHWCHVMEKESFEDREVAELLNETFVCIKVDREERPDVDQFYMMVCQMLTGSGGWPLTIIMTPDKHPFYAATYLPKYSSYGRIGMMDLIPRVAEIWKNKRQEILRDSERIIESLSRTDKSTGMLSNSELSEANAEAAFAELRDLYDPASGGFSTQPKFPTPHNLLFLLRYGYRTGNAQAFAMVERTLHKMHSGGIYDQIGFGFHRYSTDNRWLVPHFEKMLYDQALLLLAYAEAHQVTGDPYYRRVAEEIITYVLRDMKSDEGGFYSAEDADSEGEEGKFYLWTIQEIREALDEDEAAVVIRTFNLEEEGNFPGGSGTNILHRTSSFADIAADIGTTEDALKEVLSRAQEKLLRVRNQRTRPLRDDKILTDWNGLMIAALAYAGRTFAVTEYIKTAEAAADFLLAAMVTENGGLLHRYHSGEVGIPGHLDDYAALIWGLLELYEADFDPRYLVRALQLNEVMMERFRDEENGGFFFTSSRVNEVPVRLKDAYDGALPSGNSMAMMNLLRLSRITANPAYEKEAQKIGRAFFSFLRRSPASSTYLLCALEFWLNPSREVVLVGSLDDPNLQKMISALNHHYRPHLVVIHKPARPLDEIEKWMPHLKNYKMMEERSTAYVCHNFICQPPTTDLGRMLELLR